MTSLRNWWQFTVERFDPRSHSVMIALFVIVHAVGAHQILGAEVSIARGIAACAVAVLFFFKLRLYDEIKDYDTDLEFNPTRPLARGLLTLGQVKRAITGVIALEVVILSSFGLSALSMGAVAILYSLLMYREFFIGKWIRPHLTTYALSHTIVCSLLSATLIVIFSGSSPLIWPSTVWAFVLAKWFLFNVFEFGRKTFATTEERDRVPSYSKIFGKSGAVALIMAQAVPATLLYTYAFPHVSIRITLGLSAAALLIAGILYVLRNDPTWASRYRAVSSVYIVLAFLCLLLVTLEAST